MLISSSHDNDFSLMWRLWFLGLASALGLSAQVIVLQNARLIDGNGGAPLEAATVVMADGKIRDIGPSSRVKTPEAAQVVDLSGKTIMPGIINLHGHVGMVKGLSQDMANYTRENAEAQLKMYAMYGVTSTTSMGTDDDLIVEIRDEQRRGKVNGARVFTALQGFTSIGGYPTQAPGVKGVAQEVATSAQARAWVNRLADKGADVAKMWVDSHHESFKKLGPTVYSAIIEQAHKRDLLTFAHLYELSDAKGLVKAGLDVIAHSIRDEEVDDELINLLKKNNVTYVATLSREKSTFIYADSPAWLDDPFFRKGVDAATLEALKTPLKATQAKDPERDINIKGLAIAMKNIKKLSDAGVRIGFGSDTGPPARFSGYFEHWEMELMVEAGLTPMQVIQAASQTNSEALRVAKEFGTLEKGKAADLVVLNQNPLDDILNTHDIHSVYLAGQKIE
ncbi:MAG: amidohydrolase family protein [Acidobacteria bacterium]|nr:amidohydrolase family protein [Acidobacteriota bacterium]